MLSSSLLLALAPLAPLATEASLLATVPDDAYVLVHCRDVAALRARAERNDWYRLLGSSHGEPLLRSLARDFRYRTHSEMDELLELASALDGEVVLFDTGSVAGFVSEPPASRAALAGLMRGWLPDGEPVARRTLEIAGGAVELVAWPDEIDGWSGRAGHFAAFVDHPRALALYSGDSAEDVLAAMTSGLTGLTQERRAPLVTSYLAAGGGAGSGIELFVDFTPLVEDTEAALKEMVEGVLPDPSSLLGLERGTRLRANFDLFPGTRVDGRAWLHLPKDTLAAQLADTFKPLPHGLPADLPQGVWGLWALNFDLKLFYQRARAAYEAADRADGLATVDAGLEAVRGMSSVDPIVDVLNQLEGVFAVYFVDPPKEPMESRFGELEELRSLGIHAGLVDGEKFLSAFEKLIDVGGIGDVLDLQDIAGVDAYVMKNAARGNPRAPADPRVDDQSAGPVEEEESFDGGVAFLPRAFTIAPTRRVLERALLALTRVEGASLLDGSRMQAALDEHQGACFLSCIEMTPFRRMAFPKLEGDLRLPPLQDGEAARDPFDSQLVSTLHRTRDGFEFHLHTR